MTHVAVDLIVTADEIARRLGVPLPLQENDRWLIEQVIGDAQAGLEAYLGRAVTPRTYTDEHVHRMARPGADEWDLNHWPVQSITSVAEETDDDGDPTGLYTVVYVAGLDGANDPELEPLRRFVRAAAMYAPDLQQWLRRTNPEASRVVTSLGVDGQSVTWSDAYTVPGGGEAGGVGRVPSLSSCDRWRIAGRRVFQRRTLTPRPWPGGDWAYEWPYSGGF